MRKISRVVGKPKKNKEHNLSITIELALDNNILTKRNIAFGFVGALREDSELYPFVLYPNGKIDFGSDTVEDYRYGRTNLNDREIEMGNLFSFGMHYGEPLRYQEFTYEISQVADVLK